MVELAVVLPVLVLILFATFEFGRAYWQYQQLSAAASEGARKAIVSRTSGTRDSDIRDRILQNTQNFKEADLGIAIDGGQWKPGEPVKVTVTYPLEIKVPGMTALIPAGTKLTAKQSMRIER